ncbi:Sen15 protein-domain-containing protein [Xylogone sp. PMI_703]|nr:Sen15 protein-domain-containing protein [Xylogone sp. PMI_703]
MTSSTMTTAEPPAFSALTETINSSKISLQSITHPPHLQHLALTVLHNLQYQHDWTSLSLHTHSTKTSSPLPRPLISGIPPRRAYIHPDEQVEIIKVEHETGQPVKQYPEREWVLPTHLEECGSLAEFANIFDAIETVPPGDVPEISHPVTVGQQWQGESRQKRLLLATVHDDSTVVYYIMHDGIVKPRQN